MNSVYIYSDYSNVKEGVDVIFRILCKWFFLIKKKKKAL